MRDLIINKKTTIMLKLMKMKLSYVVLAVGILTAGSGYAQTPAPATQQQPTVNVEDAELAKFAEAFKEMQTESQKIQSKIMESLKQRNLDVTTFNEIRQAKMAGREPSASKEEVEKYNNAIRDLEGAQNDFQDNMEEMVKDAGFTIERYKEIGMALQTDRDLQIRLQKLLTQE